MHATSRDERGDRAGGRRLFARSWHVWADLPENPLCWLLGHFPRVQVIERTYSEPWLLTDCRVCERRHERADTAHLHERAARKIEKGEHPGPLWKAVQEEAADLIARRIAVVREHGAAYVAGNVERRHGWSKRTAEGGLSLYVGGRQVYDLGVIASVGGRGSETPLDLALYVPWASLYAKTSLGRRWAALLTGDKGSREFHATVSRGSRAGDVFEPEARLVVWGRKHEGRSADPWWVRGVRVNLNPLDRLWGSARYSYEDVQGPVNAVLRMPEGDEHFVDLTLRRETFGRPRGGRQQQSWSVQWRCDDGVPYRRDSWKGDGVHGSGCEVSAEAVESRRWVLDALAKIAARISEDRSRHGWHLPAQPPEPEVERVEAPCPECKRADCEPRVLPAVTGLMAAVGVEGTAVLPGCLPAPAQPAPGVYGPEQGREPADG